MANQFWGCTVKKDIKCSGNSEILQDILRDTTQKSKKNELIRVVSRTIVYSFSESPLHFISFLTVWVGKKGGGNGGGLRKD